MTIDVLTLFKVPFPVLGSQIVIFLPELSVACDICRCPFRLPAYLLLAVRQSLPLLAGQLGGLAQLDVIEIFAAVPLLAEEKV